MTREETYLSAYARLTELHYLYYQQNRQKPSEKLTQATDALSDIIRAWDSLYSDMHRFRDAYTSQKRRSLELSVMGAETKALIDQLKESNEELQRIVSEYENKREV